MASKKKKPVEYKDTFKFQIFPDFPYTPQQKLRLRLFQDRIEHWKRGVNYADSFKDPQNINLLYLIGYTSKLKPYMEKHTTSNLVVFCVPFTKEELELYDDYWDMMNLCKIRGELDKEGNFNKFFIEDMEKLVKYRDGHEDCDPDTAAMATSLQSTFMFADLYKEMAERTMGHFDHMIMVTRDNDEREINFSNLDGIIKSWFPRGREHLGLTGKASRVFIRPSAVRNALQAGLHKENAPKLFGLPEDTDMYALCKKEIRRCEMDINVSVRATGTADLGAIFQKMKMPPYGWDNDAHTAYCFGYAVSGYFDTAWVWDSCNTFRASECLYPALIHLITYSKYDKYVLITEDGSKLTSRFMYLFNYENATPKDELDKRILELHGLGLSERKIAEQIGNISNVAVHKRLRKMKTEPPDMPFCSVVHWICKKIEETTRWPVSVVDGHITKTIRGVTQQYGNWKSVPTFSKDSIKEALDHFTVEHCQEIKAKLDDINNYVPALIRQKYGDDVDMDNIVHFCTTQSSGWLWKADTFWECVDHHINHIGMHHRPDGWYYYDKNVDDIGLETQKRSDVGMKIAKKYNWPGNSTANIIIEVRRGMVVGVYSTDADATIEIFDRDVLGARVEYAEMRDRENILKHRVQSGELHNVLGLNGTDENDETVAESDSEAVPDG